MKRRGAQPPAKSNRGSSRAGPATATAPRTALEKVRLAIHRVKPELPLRAITAGASLVGELGVDSLKFAELSIALEDVFGEPVFLGDVLAEIEDPAAITVRDLANHLQRSG